MILFFIFFFKQKTAYEMRISDWSSDVCSSDLWFPKGLDDPDLALLRVAVEKAEYWDSPSAAMTYLYGYAKSRLTGRPPKGGENEIGRASCRERVWQYV